MLCERAERGGPMKIVQGRLRVAASDVANFLACQQLTQLDLQKAQETLRPPHARDLGFEDLVRRGQEHERAVLERFRVDGYEVADLTEAADPAGATVAAIRGEAGVIYHGTLTGAEDATALLGRPDFLVRADPLAAPDGEPRPGGRALRGGGRQASQDGEGPGRSADRVLLAAAGRTAGGRAALDAPGARPRGVRLVQSAGLRRVRAADAAAAGRGARGGAAGRAVPRAGGALCHLPVERAVQQEAAGR